MTRPTLRPVNATALLAGLFLFGCGGGGNSSVVPTSPATASLCADFQSAQAGEYAVENNTWGKGELTSFRQCVGIAAANGGRANVAFDWTWPAARRWTRSRWAASPGTCTQPPPHGAPSPGSTSPISPAPRYLVSSLDLRQFLDHLKARGSITGREWLASVELGAELMPGSGRSTLSQFKVSVE